MALANMYLGVEPNPLLGGNSSTPTYESMYTPEKISKLLGDYSSLLEPEYARSRAQIANTLGGQGVFRGTPGANKLQILEGNRMGQIGQYGMSLEQAALQEPYAQAELMGYFQGRPTLAAGTLLGSLGGQPTLTARELADKQRQAELDNLVASLSILEELATAPGASQAAKDKYQQALWDYLGRIGLGVAGTPAVTPGLPGSPPRHWEHSLPGPGAPTTGPGLPGSPAPINLLPDTPPNLLPDTPAGQIGERNVQKQNQYDQADLDFTYISKNLPGWASDPKQNTPVAKAWKQYDLLATKLEKIQNGSALEMSDAEIAKFNELSDAFTRYIAAGGDALNNDPVFVRYTGGTTVPSPVVTPTPTVRTSPVVTPTGGFPKSTPRVGGSMRAF